MMFLLVFLGFLNTSNVGAVTPDTTDLTFLSHGRKMTALSVDALKRDVMPEQMEVYEPLEKNKKKYQGFPVLDLLKKIYGSELDKADILSIYCSDGYRADIPIEEFKKTKASLAFALVDGTPFTLKSGGKLIPLGPYYLVWNHPDADSAKRNTYRWPYAVDKLDVINSKTAYAPLDLKEASLKIGDEIKNELKLGQQKYMVHCLSCHNIKGVGGHRGPALDGLMATLETSFLTKYILDPQGMNKASQMSGLPKDLKNREQIAAAIVKYGKSISKPTQ